jgi:hypothetical protein
MWHTRHRFAYPHGGSAGAHHPGFTQEEWAEWKTALKWGVIVALLSVLLLSLPPSAK